MTVASMLHSDDIALLPRLAAEEAMRRRPPVLVWSVREFENLSPKQQRDLLFAHTLGRFDLDLSSDYPEMGPDDWRRLSGREKRILMQPVRGGMVANPQFAAASLTISTTAYTAGDMLGTEVTWTGMATGNGRSGTVLSANVTDYSKITGAINLFMANAALTSVAADNAANSWADQTSLGGGLMIPFGTPVPSALNSYAEVANLGLTYTCGSSSTSLFADGVTTIGHTFFGGATDLKYAAEILYD